MLPRPRLRALSRIGVIADAHANLPATVAALDALVDAGCTTIVHAGDAIGIGPHPAEVIELLLDRRVRCVMGNHDAWFAFGLPEPRPAWMSEGEVEHQRWTHRQLSDAHRAAARRWPYELAVEVGDATATLVHYARTPSGGFAHLRRPTAEDFDRLYADLAGGVVVFGHDHRPYDLSFGGRRFLNPGSLGCHDRPEARALVLAPAGAGNVEVSRLAIPYDDAALLADFDRRRVPEREFIRQAFVRRP